MLDKLILRSKYNQLQLIIADSIHNHQSLGLQRYPFCQSINYKPRIITFSFIESTKSCKSLVKFPDIESIVNSE